MVGLVTHNVLVYCMRLQPFLLRDWFSKIVFAPHLHVAWIL